MTSLDMLLNEIYTDVKLLHARDLERTAYTEGKTEVALLAGLIVDLLTELEAFEEATA